MNSIKFPNMFGTNNTNVYKNNEYLKATKQNFTLLLQSEKGELLGDPYYGLLIKRFLFEPNSQILRDNLIDMIYTQCAQFIPQVKLKRNDISITTDKNRGRIYCTIKGINQIDYLPNTYNLVLYQGTDDIK